MLVFNHLLSGNTKNYLYHHITVPIKVVYKYKEDDCILSTVLHLHIIYCDYKWVYRSYKSAIMWVRNDGYYLNSIIGLVSG